MTSEYAKAYAAALTVVLFWAVKGIFTGDWSAEDTLQAAVTTLLVPIVVWAVPNDRP